VALGIVALLLLLVVMLLARRVRRVDARLRGLTRGDDGVDLEGVLGAHLDKVYTLGREVERLGARTGALETSGLRAFQRVGLVRFNPFEDTGGNQSFALALLDGHGDGFVVSSLHSRTGTRIYAKAIAAGASDTALSEEESGALQQALAKPAPGAAA
jgi:hypothetical protein